MSLSEFKGCVQHLAKFLFTLQIKMHYMGMLFWGVCLSSGLGMVAQEGIGQNLILLSSLCVQTILIFENTLINLQTIRDS